MSLGIVSINFGRGYSLSQVDPFAVKCVVHRLQLTFIRLVLLVKCKCHLFECVGWSTILISVAAFCCPCCFLGVSHGVDFNTIVESGGHPLAIFVNTALRNFPVKDLLLFLFMVSRGISKPISTWRKDVAMVWMLLVRLLRGNLCRT